MELRNRKNNVQNNNLKSDFDSFKSRFLQSGQDPQQVLNELVRTGKVNKEQLDRATKLAQMYSWLIR